MTNITVDRNLLEQVLKTLQAGTDVDPVFAGETEDALKAVLAESVEEPWEHLKQYGYAPGSYMSRCHNCDKIAYHVDKRAITCRPCAEVRHAESQKTEPVEEPVATVVMRHYIDGTYAGNALKWNSRNGEDDLPVGTKLYTTPPASEMRLIHHVFGEFREPLYQIRKAVMKGNSGEALQLLGDLENQMFKI